MSDPMKHIANLSAEEKRKLLAQLLRKKAEEGKENGSGGSDPHARQFSTQSAVATRSRVGRSPLEESFSLSQGQQALWFLYRLAPESAAYNLLYAAHISSRLDIPLLQQAVNALVRRYPILTVTYAMDGKELTQRFHKDQTVSLEVIDASNWSLAYLRSVLDEEGNRPFSLEQGPILRLKLFLRSEQDSILSLAIHHIAADLWSLDLLVEELLMLYAAEKAGVQASLPPVGPQYMDYVRWQQNMLAGPEGERLLTYWQHVLAGELPVLSLPTDRLRPAVQSYRGASHSFKLSEKLSQQLRAMASAEKVTLYALLLAAFKVLLFRYTDQEDLLIGTPTLGRNHADLERVIGYLANPVVLRTNLGGNPTFRDFLHQVKQVAAAAIEHQDYPFPLLVEKLQPKRDPGYSPIIQTLFIWDRPRTYKTYDTAHFGGNEIARRIAQEMLVLEPFVVGQQGAPFDLTLTIFEVEGSLSADFRYNIDLFDATTIARMERHFQVLMAGIVADPDMRLLELPLLAEEEQRHLLVEWNDTRSPYPEQLGIHQQFEQQVERTPDAVALIFEDQRLSYRDLNRQANRVAYTLQSAGIGPDSLVGVCMERSLEMVIALFAILKAGGAYVPLEPAYPQERLSYMIQDAGINIVLTQQRLCHLLPADRHILCLDTREQDSTAKYEENPISAVRPDNLIYMLYTSGSTGRPKGVMNIHGAVSNRLHWMQQAYQLTGTDRVMQKTPFSFDVSAWEFFWPLLNGAALVIARPGGHQDTRYLASLIESQQVTTLHFVPSMLQAFLEEQGLERCVSLKHVICSGEALSPDLQERFFARFKTSKLYNLYGPTEAAIDVTSWQCRTDSKETTVPIGHPIANIQIYILNRALQPVPAGIAGELYIGGVGLARGYFQRPDLTAERFIADPFSREPGARLFKTGDLARYRTDGAIEFLGRIDHQVKIRGVRIELGEIEAALAQHPAVKEVVALAREDPPGNKRLVAYLVPTEQVREKPISIEELRAFLKEKLPQEMIPTAFVSLDTLPLTANGKLNRAALPLPDRERPELEASYVAPHTEIEEQLVQIWRQVLGIDKIGIHDNFFDLGGASIETLQVIAKANELGYQLTPEVIFEHQTIAELASACGHQQTGHTGVSDAAGDNGRQAVAQSTITPALEQSAHSDMSNTLIESIGVYLPPEIVSTKAVLEQCSTPIRFPLEQMTGIKNRRMAGESEFAFDLAVKATENCLANSRYNPEDIDLVICSSISRYDGPNARVTFEPGTAIRLRQHFGFANALVFDISNACTGMFTAMNIIDAFLKAGFIRRGMVVSGEYITHLTRTAQKEIESYLDSRLPCLTVGDAGAAVILERSANNNVGFHEFEMYTLGRYYDLCIAKATDKEHGGAIMYTDAVRVSATNIKQAVSHAAHVIERSGWPHEAFQHIIMHQTSKTTIHDAAREINNYFGKELCHQDNLINNIAERGNTATTTHIVALLDYILAGKIRSGSNAVFGITGSGVNIGTALYTFDDLPDRLRRYASGEQTPVKITAGEQKPRVVLPSTGRIRIESIGTFPLESQAKRETLTLSGTAAENCLARSSYNRNDIDLLIYAGIYRDDFICEPSIASMVLGTLQINDTIEFQQDKKTFSFDLFNGAIGFLDACYTAIGMIRGQKIRNAMIVASEVENNRNIPAEELRGIEEAGSAIILDANPEGKAGFGNFLFRNFTEYVTTFAAYTVPRTGGMSLRFERNSELEACYLQCICDTVRELLASEQLDLSQIKVILPPQISSEFTQKLSAQLGLDGHLFVDVHAGHTDHAYRDLFTSSLPYTLQQMYEKDMVKSGDIGLIIGVGTGIQVGCATYYF